MDLVYADDVDGGPDCVGTVSALVFHANNAISVRDDGRNYTI
jgi:hypothetical protein